MRFFFLTLLLSAHGVKAMPLAGAWERFDTEANANDWGLYSYDDKQIAPPGWAGPDIDDNPYAFSSFFGGEGVWFFADEFTADGAFVGDFATQKISGVDVSVWIDPADLDFIELVVFADGPDGWGYYYSLIYAPEDLGIDPDWYGLRFFFDDDWFYIGDDGTYVAFRPEEKFLASIDEIGLRVFPVAGVTELSYVGLDDFILVPTEKISPPRTSIAGGLFALSFTVNPGVTGSVERLVSGNWQEVAGQTGLTGAQVFTTPLTPGTGIFRVVTEQVLTPIE